jgi:hypothetical protein
MAMNPRLLVPRATSFDPRSIAGLEAWWDAADASTLFDAATGGSLVANDGDVGRWEDKSGNARHFEQGTAANRPLRKPASINGRHGVYFDGNNDLLKIPSSQASFNFLHNATGGHVFIVFEPDAGQGDIKLLFTNNSSNGSVSGQTGTYFRYDEAAERPVFVSVSSGVLRVARWLDDASTPADTPYVFSMQFDAHNATAGDRLDAYRNGTAISPTVITSASETGIATANNASQEMTMGASSGTAANWFAGSIGEVIIYSGLLSDAARINVTKYLQRKWAVL